MISKFSLEHKKFDLFALSCFMQPLFLSPPFHKNFYSWKATAYKLLFSPLSFDYFTATILFTLNICSTLPVLISKRIGKYSGCISIGQGFLI